MEEIISRLRKVKDDKKVDLYRTFLKHVQDIQQEREMILKLLGSSFIPSSSEQNDHEDVIANSKKRKSPETALFVEKLSPEQKRVSKGLEQYLLEEGYHTDATRLKKEQLLELLDKRGIQGFTMKTLKVQMIEALKVSFCNSSLMQENSSIETNICSKTETPRKLDLEGKQQDAEVPAADSTLHKTPGRTGSLMSEFRNLVNGNNNLNQSNEEWVRKEFESRQSRHRDSQARKSSAGPEKRCLVAESPDSVNEEKTTISDQGKSAWAEIESPAHDQNENLVENVTHDTASAITSTEQIREVNKHPTQQKKTAAPVKPVNPTVDKAKFSKFTEEQKLLVKKKELKPIEKGSTVKPSQSKKPGIFNMFVKELPVTAGVPPISKVASANQIKLPGCTQSAIPDASAQPTIDAPITTKLESKIELPAVLQEIKVSVTESTVNGDSFRHESLQDEYVIESRSDDTSDDGNSDTDDETNEKKQQNIPEWARGDFLRQALERQYGLNGHTPVDPDLIFPEVQTCSLEEIFGKREGLTRKYSSRTSSAHWDADQLTLVEKRQYRLHMGYEQSQPLSTSKLHPIF